MILPERDRNLARAAELALERLGDQRSLFFEGTWYSSAAQAERANRVGAALVDLGVEPGDRVVVMMENSADVTVVYQAIWRAGAVITPAIFLLSPHDLRRIITDSGATAIIAAPSFLETVATACEGNDTVRVTISTGPPAEGVVSLGDLAAHDTGEIVMRANEELAVLLYTGGTTGASKGVMLTHSNLWQAGWAARQMRQGDLNRFISCLPLSHSFGVLGLAIGLHADEPSTSVLMKWFDPVQWLELAQEHRVQAGAFVPAMLYALLRQPLESYDLSELRLIGSGAAPLAAETREELSRRLPQLQVREGYGLTESAASLTSMRMDAIKAGTVGQAVPGCELRLCDEHGNEVPIGEIGEVCARSGTVMKGYWNSPELTAETLRDGWLHTGDLARIDDEGFLTIVGRKKEIIIRGGFNVYPRDVSEALLEHPAIATVGVIGRPDPRHGEEVVAFVTLAPGAQAEPRELVAWAKEQIGGYKYPREIHVLDELPLTPVGKLDKKALREHLATV
jgi:long-chain acyl-CoA synthetase